MEMLLGDSPVKRSDPTPPAVVLLSGGMDSSVLLAHIIKLLGRSEVHCLSFNYGQRHIKELACAKWQITQYPEVVSWEILPIDFMGEFLGKASALVGGRTMPALSELSEEELQQPASYVPHRNMMLLSIACSYAEANGITSVYYGAQLQDHYGYWDCTDIFLERFNAVLGLNHRNAVVVRAPFVKHYKYQLIRLGLQLGVDFSHTWSCYRGLDRACGVCPTCVERLEAFKKVCVKDPILYEE